MDPRKALRVVFGLDLVLNLLNLVSVLTTRVMGLEREEEA